MRARLFSTVALKMLVQFATWQGAWVELFDFFVYLVAIWLLLQGEFWQNGSTNEHDCTEDTAIKQHLCLELMFVLGKVFLAQSNVRPV
jgi:hypothetical protein